MKVIIRTSWALVLLFILSSVSAFAFAPGEEYLFDSLKKPAYRASWNAMFKGEKNVPAWLANFAKTYNGPTSPCKPLNIDGVEYKVHSVCKALRAGGTEGVGCAFHFFATLLWPPGSKNEKRAGEG